MTEISHGSDAVELTILLPCFNEEAAIGPVIGEIRAAMDGWPGTWELLVVDDASTDRTVELAREEGARVIRRVENGGAGAARKTGIRAARGSLVAMLDADGTYVPAHLPELLSHFPDLNTGMKIFRRDLMKHYMWVIPDGFSCVTSMSMAFLCNGHAVKYVPVEYRKRIGKSKFHPLTDTFHYIMTIFRLMVYFRPLRVFAPLAGVVGALGVGKGLYNWLFSAATTLQESDVIAVIGATLILSVGLLAELIVAQRREPAALEAIQSGEAGYPRAASLPNAPQLPMDIADEAPRQRRAA